MRHHYRIQQVPGEGVLLLGDRESFWLRGRLYELLAPPLQSGIAESELVEGLAGHLSAAEVYYGIERLREAGHLAAEDDLEARSPASGYWHALGVHAQAATGSLGQLAIAVACTKGVDIAPFVRALGEAGIALRPNARLRLVVCHDYLDPSLSDVNAEALRTGVPWLIVRPTGTRPWLGPLFRPREGGPCWECCASRIRENQSAESVLRRQGGDPRLSWSTTIATPCSVNSVAALVAAQLVAFGLDAKLTLGTLEALRVIDPISLAVERHAVTRRPQCPACGDPGLVATRQYAPALLEAAPVRFSADGGYRTSTPDEVLTRFEHLISPITGIIPALVPVEPVAEGGECAPVVDAGHNPARSDPTLGSLMQSFRHRSMGKGKSRAQAMASGMCEALERYCGVYRGDEARVRARPRELDAPAVLPMELQLFSEAQYAARDAWNRRHRSRFHQVPPPFDPAEAIDWTPAWSLTAQARRWLPTALSFYDYREPDVPYFGSADSNGCAAGSSFAEATLQGFFELVERDAIALWWYNRASRPALDLDLERTRDPYVGELRRFYRSMQRELWVLDVTSDLRIPVFAALSRSVASDGPEAITYGFGCHLDPAIALSRALTEMNQFLPFVESYRAGQLSAETDAGRWFTQATLAGDPYLAPAKGALAPSWEERERFGTGDIRADVERVVAIAADRGLETIVVDQTRPDVGLSVVRVAVSGLRHFWPRFAPGRLFDVPVALGWLRSRSHEAELNPFPVIF